MPRSPRRLILPALLLLLLAAGGGAWLAGVRPPPRWDPFAPPDLMEEPGPWTAWKLARLREDPALCLSTLGRTDLPHAPAPDRPLRQGCGYRDAVRVDPTGLGSRDSFVVTCGVAAAWVLFLRHAVQPAAREHLGQEVARVETLGTYNCRDIGGGLGEALRRRSQHATANAIDVSGFVLADGRRVTLLRDWQGDDADARFLRAVRDGACRFFRVVLGPDYNAAHADHFHLDMGPSRACR